LKELTPVPAAATVPAIGAMEGGQCDRMRTGLWVTIEDVGAVGTSATESAKKVSTLSVAEWKDFPHLPEISAMIGGETVSEAATASAAETLAATVLAAGDLAVLAVHAAAAVVAETACLLRLLAPAKAR
jgi:hypothetical protein